MSSDTRTTPIQLVSDVPVCGISILLCIVTIWHTFGYVVKSHFETRSDAIQLANKGQKRSNCSPRLTSILCLFRFADHSDVILVTALRNAPPPMRAEGDGGFVALATKRVKPNRTGSAAKRLAARHHELRALVLQLFAGDIGVTDVKVLPTHCSPAALGVIRAALVEHLQPAGGDNAGSSESQRWIRWINNGNRTE